jgi:hypothetical protein
VKLYVPLPGETKKAMESLADIDGVEPPKRIHMMLRKFIWEVDPRQAQFGATSLAAQISALRQRGHLRLGDRTLLSEELEALTENQFAFPTDQKPSKDAIEVVFSQRLGDMLPVSLAFLDMQATPEFRRIRGWTDLPSFVKSYVTGQVAQEMAKNESREVEDEEQALYPAKKAEPKKKGD